MLAVVHLGNPSACGVEKHKRVVRGWANPPAHFANALIMVMCEDMADVDASWPAMGSRVRGVFGVICDWKQVVGGGGGRRGDPLFPSGP